MVAEAETDVQTLWRSYRKQPTREMRDRLVTMYLHIVRFNAERIRAKLPSEVELDDLISAGTFGLMDAVESFDLSRGVKFETYCSTRIRGAILDELRSLDWVPRLVRTRGNKLEQATKRLQNELGRLPTDQELAGHLGAEPEEYARIVRDSHATGVLSLSRKMVDAGSEGHGSDFLRDPRGVDPVTEAEQRDLRELLARQLSQTEQLVLVLYYFEGMTMKEIGATLDLSESRVSQMHSAILDRLRTNLKKNPNDLLVEACP